MLYHFMHIDWLCHIACVNGKVIQLDVFLITKHYNFLFFFPDLMFFIVFKVLVLGFFHNIFPLTIPLP